jgi:hypothetical protein
VRARYTGADPIVESRRKAIVVTTVSSARMRRIGTPGWAEVGAESISFSRGKRSCELPPEVWSNTLNVVLGSAKGKPCQRNRTVP